MNNVLHVFFSFLCSLKGLLPKKNCFLMVDGPSLDEFDATLVASQGPPIDLLQA